LYILDFDAMQKGVFFMNKKETKEKEPKHAHLPTRKSGWRQRKQLTPEESEKILKRVFLGIDDENEN
jgi:hypothetical protein